MCVCVREREREKERERERSRKGDIRDEEARKQNEDNIEKVNHKQISIDNRYFLFSECILPFQCVTNITKPYQQRKGGKLALSCKISTYP